MIMTHILISSSQNLQSEWFAWFNKQAVHFLYRALC